MPIPRESMHLEGDPEAPRLITTRTRKDLTDQMVTWANRRVRQLEKEQLCGFIFKSRSPSCGITDTPILVNSKEVYGSGLYARQIIEAFPLLPVTDEVSLRHENHVDHFLEHSP